MKQSEYERAVHEDEREKGADFICWMPPGGHAIECQSLDEAANLARRMAGRHPGKVICVYQRVGQALSPYREPDFTPATLPQIENKPE